MNTNKEQNFHIYHDEKNQVTIACCKYHGQNVRVTTKPVKGDVYNRELGEKIAIAKLHREISKIKMAFADKNLAEAEEMLQWAHENLQKAEAFVVEAVNEFNENYAAFNSLAN